MCIELKKEMNVSQFPNPGDTQII